MSEETETKGGDAREQFETGTKDKIGDHVVFIGNKPFMKLR